MTLGRKKLMNEVPTTQEIVLREGEAWETFRAAASMAVIEREVYRWGVSSLPYFAKLAGTHRIGFATAGPDDEDQLRFAFATPTARRIYGQLVVGSLVRDRIPEGRRADHDRGLAESAASDYLTQEGKPVIHEEDVLRLDGALTRCRFVVRQFQGAPAASRFAQIIWRVADER